jgi:hypothetical protein
MASKKIGVSRYHLDIKKQKKLSCKTLYFCKINQKLKKQTTKICILSIETDTVSLRKHTTTL